MSADLSFRVAGGSVCIDTAELSQQHFHLRVEIHVGSLWMQLRGELPNDEEIVGNGECSAQCLAVGRRSANQTCGTNLDCARQIDATAHPARPAEINIFIPAALLNSQHSREEQL